MMVNHNGYLERKNNLKRKYQMAQHIDWYSAMCYANLKSKNPEEFDELFQMGPDKEEMSKDESAATSPKIGLKRPDWSPTHLYDISDA